MVAATQELRTALEHSAKLRRMTKPRLTKYIPNRPTRKQRMAMCLNHVLELFYGGALGGGKSEWLLAEALQYVDIPDYHALILRRTLTDAKNPGSILFRANQWLAGTDAKVRDGMWVFPSGATLSFGGLDKRNDHFKYAGAEYAFIGVDEATQLDPKQFEFVTGSRLRKPGCDLHNNVRDPDCKFCQPYMHTNQFPLRIRVASNPGGISHTFFKNRYDIGPIPGKVGPMGYQMYAGRNPEKPHIPAFIQDNPFLNADAYIERLRCTMKTDPVTLQQLLAGDWGITADSRFKRQWIKRYTLEYGTHVTIDGKAYPIDRCYQFLMIDPASSSKDSPGKSELSKKQASYTVVSRWLVTPQNHLCLMHVRRFQKEMPEIVPEIREEMKAAAGFCRFVGMEHTTQSIYLFQHCQREGLPMKAFTTGGKDKVARAFDATTRMEQGKLLLPDRPSQWLQEYEDEVFVWTGEKEQTDDQVDVTSYAAIHMTNSVTIKNAGLPSVL